MFIWKKNQIFIDIYFFPYFMHFIPFSKGISEIEIASFTVQVGCSCPACFFKKYGIKCISI